MTLQIRWTSAVLMSAVGAACGGSSSARASEPTLEVDPVFAHTSAPDSGADGVAGLPAPGSDGRGSPGLEPGSTQPSDGCEGGGATSGGTTTGETGASGAGGTGTGSTGSGERAVCSDVEKRCAVELRYSSPRGTEGAVEVRGTFAPDGWVAGVPLERRGADWVGTLRIPWGVDVQYKLVLDSSTWTLDDSKPKVADGPYVNNLLQGVTCPETYTCAGAGGGAGGGTGTGVDGGGTGGGADGGAGPNGAAVFDWRDAVIYSVFVDRFHDADRTNNCTVGGVASLANYMGGDWKGVTERINAGYFSDLGVNTLLLTNVIDNYDGAGRGLDSRTYSAYHGYWPSRLDEPERCLGTEAELKELVATAHAHGMKVLLDYAMVHVHIESEIYRQHPDWFWPLQHNGGDCTCEGGSCSWDANGDRCWFTTYLPHWNFNNPAARAYSAQNVVDWVLRVGFDGIRADAIKHVHPSWMSELRQRLAATLHPTQSPAQRFYIVGETFDFGNREYLRSFIDPRSKLDGQFDFPLRKELLQATVRRASPLWALKDFMDGNDNFYGPGAVMSTWIGNHDIGRIIHQAEDRPWWDEWDNGSKSCGWSGPQAVNYRAPYERVAVAFGVLMTNRGAPFIYYGDEVGLPGCNDPDNRRMMQWSGLTADQQWLHERLKRLGKIREQHPALRRGWRRTINVSHETWVYAMTGEGETIYVAVNRGDAAAPVSGLPGGRLVELVEGRSFIGPADAVPARQVRIYKAGS